VGWYIITIKSAQRRIAKKSIRDRNFRRNKTEPRSIRAGHLPKQVGDMLDHRGILSARVFYYLLVAGNTMRQSVRERIGELGAEGDWITKHPRAFTCAAESCLLAIIGGVLGLESHGY